MNPPETSYEAASLELTQFRERRLSERRSALRPSNDRRTARVEDSVASAQNEKSSASAHAVTGLASHE